MEIIYSPDSSQWKRLLSRPAFENTSLEATVQAVLNDVKANGNAAVLRYSQKFDNPSITNFEVSQTEIDAAEQNVSSELKNAIEIAKNNITAFHSKQAEKASPIETMPGVKCWRKSVGIQRVGLYIPGGTAPLFGVDKIYKIGGSQAIAAMAFGTETIPKVSKIFGPGNQYVTMAKMLVAKEGVAIDMPAGPSEVMVVADETAVPAFVASDLLSQCEHGADSQAILLSTHKPFIEEVKLEIEKQLAQLARKELASKSLEFSKLIYVDNQADLIDLINEYAPEHLILSVKNCNELGEKIINAGSVFLGNYSPESAGDYASGTNHTLPTNGYAKAYSGVSLDSFVRKITFQEITNEGLSLIGPAIETMAEAEMLDAHKNAVTIRLKKF